MKKMTFITLFLLVVSSVSANEFALNFHNNNNLKINGGVGGGHLARLTTDRFAQLYDGRKFSVRNEVVEIGLYNQNIDFLELTNGEIIDRTDILNLNELNYGKIWILDNLGKAIGVDGGG